MASNVKLEDAFRFLHETGIFPIFGARDTGASEQDAVSPHPRVALREGYGSEIGVTVFAASRNRRCLVAKSVGLRLT